MKTISSDLGHRVGMTNVPADAFSTRRLDELGLTRRQVQSSQWLHPYRGSVRHISAAGDEPQIRIKDVAALLLPGCLIGGWAAAHLQGVRYLDGTDPRGEPRDVPVHITERHRLRRRAGMSVTRRAVHRNEQTEIEGIAVTTLARAAYDMALDARTLREAVIAFDQCLSTTSGYAHTTVGNLSRVVGAHKKTRGINRARDALRLVSTRSASPGESATRMIAILDARITHWLVNAPIFDMRGDLIGIADLLNVEAGLVVESDGADHIGFDALSKDHVREESLEHSGLIVVRVNRVDHEQRLRTAGRIRRAYERGRADPRPARWTLDKPAWWASWKHALRWG